MKDFFEIPTKHLPIALPLFYPFVLCTEKMDCGRYRDISILFCIYELLHRYRTTFKILKVVLQARNYQFVPVY